MFTRIRRDIAVVAAALAAVLLPGASVLADGADGMKEEPGPVLRVLSTGLLHLRGAAWRRPAGLLDLGDVEPDRITDIVISQVLRDEEWPQEPDDVETGEQAWAEARTYFAFRGVAGEGFVSQVETVDLIRGYAYVKMTPGPGNQMLTLSFREAIERLLRDRAWLVPIVGVLGQELSLDEVQRVQLRRAMDEGLAYLAAAPMWQALLFPELAPEFQGEIRRLPDPMRQSQPGPLRSIRDEIARMGPEALVEIVLSPDFARPDDRFRRSMATAFLVKFAIEHRGLAPHMSLLHYPFIVSRRSSGGAEGTEIVIYARDIPTAPGAAFDQCEVYYFFLHSEMVNQIEIAAYLTDPLAPDMEKLMEHTFKLDRCHYARVRLRRALPGTTGSRAWHMAGLSSITAHPISNAISADLKTVLRQAYRDAVRAGIDPIGDPDCAVADWFDWTESELKMQPKQSEPAGSEG